MPGQPAPWPDRQEAPQPPTGIAAITPHKLMQRADNAKRYDEFNEYWDRVENPFLSSSTNAAKECNTLAFLRGPIALCTPKKQLV